MDYVSDDEVPVEVPVNSDLPDFVVVPSKLWQNKTVTIYSDDNIPLAEGLIRNPRSSLVSDTVGPLDNSVVVVQVSRSLVEEESEDDWRYSFKTWPISHVYLDGVSLEHHSQRDVHNRWVAERNRSLGDRTRSYDNSSRNTPPPISRHAEFQMTQPSINSVAANTCYAHLCVQYYPRDKISTLRSRMYDKTTVQFRNHIKLDVHRQIHKNSAGSVVTLEGIDVCPFAWMKIMGVSSSTFYRNAKYAAAGFEAQFHGNTGLRKPRNHTVVATAVLGAILDRHADHMPHKSRVLPSGETVVAKVLASSFKWKEQIPILDEHLADCGLPPMSASNLSKIRRLSYPEYYAKRAGDNFARCSKCDEFQSQKKLTLIGSHASLLWSKKMRLHNDSAMVHRDLYYLNRFTSKATPHEVLTIMHDKMDHSKTASPALSHKANHLDGLMKLPLAVMGMLAHGHVDQRYAHYSLDIYLHDANYTHGSEMCLDPLGPPPEVPVAAKPLPPILNVQIDNAVSDNKNRFVFSLWSLLVAKRVFREVYVNFMLVGHTHDDIDALFGRWSMALRREDFPTVPLLMKSFMKNEAVPTIPYLIQEVLDFKKFIAEWMLDGDDTLMGHTKAHQFKFYLWKEDSEGRSLWPRGVPGAVAPREMRHLPDVIKGFSGFVDHWERLSSDSVESRRIYEPLSYYWNDVKEALSIPFDAVPALEHGFWPSTRLAHSVEDEFQEDGTLCEEFAEDDHFVGHKRDRPRPSFRVARDLFAGYFLALRPCDEDDRLFSLARTLTDPNSNPNLPNTIQVEFYRPISRDEIFLKFYTGWDVDGRLRWTIEKDVPESWQSTDAVITTWKSKVKKNVNERGLGKDPTLKIPLKQLDIIKASLERFVSPDSE
ncbi:hypothetical protein KC19_VG296900 [Ceratodon purpureus]|uniref:DUF7869 domain-containing protein n=1 Tax=Ceratodon purpureus TaxID=3225 RepID=A0A8T0HVY1_CERPU|nr:hypothetical protein KC19_VG296900 [Ceratodon purpureus]